MKDELTAEIYNSWRRHPVTEALFARMAAEVEDIKESWLSDHFNEASPTATLLAQAREQERAFVYRALISQTADEFLQSVGGE
jgi:hypothetical protein